MANRKIDLYRVHRNERGRIARTEYVCSTNWAATCRDAVDKFHAINAGGEGRAPAGTSGGLGLGNIDYAVNARQRRKPGLAGYHTSQPHPTQEN